MTDGIGQTTGAPADNRATPAASTDPDALRISHIAKRFGAVIALRDVNLHVGKGEILYALVGVTIRRLPQSPRNRQNGGHAK